LTYKQAFRSLFEMSAQETAIELFKSLGFEERGQTKTGRTRLELPGSQLHASVGKRTVSIFKSENSDAYDYQNFNTTDLDGMKTAVLRQVH
jgi:hypothetical protein